MINKVGFVSKYIINNFRKNRLSNMRSNVEYINIPNLDTYVPQGICVIDKIYTLITLYDGNKLDNSKIIILKEKEYYKTVYIDEKYHLGGITYDDIHENIWITTTRGCISAYDKKTILKAINNETIYPKFNNIKLGNDFINIFKQNRIAYITYHNNKIYVGNYHDDNKSILKTFSLNDDGSINDKKFETHKFIGYTQGITFYNNYLLVSSSCGRAFKSRLAILDTDTNESNTYLFPSMMEQITVQDNVLYILFEINAKKFNNHDKKRKDILMYNISDFINLK